MMRKLATAVALCVSCTFVWLVVAHGQRRAIGTWSQIGQNGQLTGFQGTEDRITHDNAKDIKMLWNLKLSASTDYTPVPTEPLFAGRTIVEAGFKDMAIILGPGNNLYNVDYELGRMVWQKHYDIQLNEPMSCAGGQFSAVVVQPQAVRNFSRAARGARAARGPVSRPAPTPPSARRVGGTASASGFGSRGIYVLTSDGYLHEQLLSNGEDYGFPIKVMPYMNGNLSDLSMEGNVLYVNTTGNCGGNMQVGGTWDAEPNGSWAIDVGSADTKVTPYETGTVDVGGLSGPARSTDNKTLYVTTGSGPANVVTGGVYPNGVVALDAATMGVTDYYAPMGPGANAQTNTNVSPIVFAYGGRDVIAAYDSGRLVLLDSKSLGGADHHTPLAISGPIGGNNGSGAWGRLASAELNNARWIFVSVQGPRTSDVTFPSAHGATPAGSIVAFEVQQQAGKTVLTPEWVSPNMANPSPAVVVSGLVLSLANGQTGGPNATLYALDAATGAPLFTSGTQITSPGYFSSISVSLGHILFVTEDDTLYSFGIGIPHWPKGATE